VKISRATLSVKNRKDRTTGTTGKIKTKWKHTKMENSERHNFWEDSNKGLTFCCTISEAFQAFRDAAGGTAGKDFNELNLLPLNQKHNGRLLENEFIDRNLVSKDKR
jgi:hypothetical protein